MIDKIQLKFPARPSGSGIHPSHKISNKRRMRGRGLDFELLNKEQNDVDHVNVDKLVKPYRKEPHFVKYVVNLNLLIKGISAMRKPSGAHVNELKRHLSSYQLKTLIIDIIYDKKFNENDYKSLDDEEKKSFDDLLTLSKLER